jgi:hypothetical protein
MSFELGRKSDFELDRNLCEKKPALCEKHTSQCEKKTNYVFLKHRVRLSASCDQKFFLCDKAIIPIYIYIYIYTNITNVFPSE